MNIWAKRLYLLLLCLMISCAALAREGKLVFVIDIIRHGERAPVLNIPKGELKLREEELGQLTPVGMRQEFHLGKALHNHYIKQLYPRRWGTNCTISQFETLVM